ncbi:MAG: hypothetical protein ABI559_09505 [Chloroflexota bacterium]
MSFKKAIWWRSAGALAVLALAVGALSLTGSGTAFAGGDGSVAVNPNPKEIGVSGQGDVTVDLTPAAAGTSIWIIQIAYDPTVAQVATDGSGNPICTVPNDDPAAADAYGCDTKDTNADQVDDTAVAFGGYVVNDNGTAKGLTSPKTVATFTFKAIGAAGTNTPLTTTVTSFLGPNGETPTPTTTNGQINIVASSGQSIIWGDVDCNGSVGPRDGQAILKSVLEQPALSQTEPCPDAGATVTVDGTSRIWADVDCNGSIGPRDGQAILKSVLEQPALSQTEPCPDVGATVTVS